MSNFSKLRNQAIISAIVICVCILFIANVIKRDKKNSEQMVHTLTALIKAATERAYAEGQKDAIDGDIRIQKLNDTTYVWTESPWNSGTKVEKDTLILK